MKGERLERNATVWLYVTALLGSIALQCYHALTVHYVTCLLELLTKLNQNIKLR